MLFSAELWTLPGTYYQLRACRCFVICISREDDTIGRFVFPLRLPCGLLVVLDVTQTVVFFSCCDSVLGATQFFKHLGFSTSLSPWKQLLLYRLKARFAPSAHDCAASRCQHFSSVYEW